MMSKLPHRPGAGTRRGQVMRGTVEHRDDGTGAACPTGVPVVERVDLVQPRRADVGERDGDRADVLPGRDGDLGLEPRAPPRHA